MQPGNILPFRYVIALYTALNIVFVSWLTVRVKTGLKVWKNSSISSRGTEGWIDGQINAFQALFRQTIVVLPYTRFPHLPFFFQCSKRVLLTFWHHI